MKIISALRKDQLNEPLLAAYYCTFLAATGEKKEGARIPRAQKTNATASRRGHYSRALRNTE